MAEADPGDDLPAPPERSPERPAAGRYATLEIGDGETVIYDRENPRAWLQSDGAVRVPSAD